MIKMLTTAIIGMTVFGYVSCSSVSDSDLSSDTATKIQPQKSEEPLPATNKFFPSTPSVAVKNSSTSLSKDRHGYPKYPISQRKRLVRTTSYSHMENEPGAPGRLNASGTTLKYGRVRSAAADWSVYPLGTKFKISGLPHTYVVDDYGSGLVGGHSIDIFHPSLRSMRKWGTRPAEITIIQWGDWDRSLALLKGRRGYRHCAKMYAGIKRRVTSGETASVSVAKPDPSEG